MCEEDSEEEYTEADPVLDDLYTRKVQLSHHQTSTNLNYNRYMPRHWTPEEDVHVRKIYQGSKKRPWYRKLFDLRSVDY